MMEATPVAASEVCPTKSETERKEDRYKAEFEIIHYMSFLHKKYVAFLS